MGPARMREITRKGLRLSAVTLVCLASAATAPESARAVELRRVASFDQPVYLTAPRGDGRRVFVVERGGRVSVLRRGRKLGRPFLDIGRLVQFFDRDNVRRDQGGLLSLAFSPGYRRNGRFYVFYTHRDGRLHVDEFRRSRRSPDRARASTRRTVLTVPRRSRNDLGGQLAFGPDRRLYIGLGYGRDPQSSQDLSRLTGKILRVDPRRAGRRAYRIPADNPFLLQPGARPEIYAYGLRVPWRFSFDRRTGALAIGDVGETGAEEVNYLRGPAGAGANFGWPVFEGRRRIADGDVSAVSPVVVRRHRRGGCAAMIGGYVVRHRSLTGLRGRYIYGDLCSGRVRSARLRRPRAVGDRSERLLVPYLVSFGEDARGRLYAISLDGPVYRLVDR
jgi:glucose/arabinose dehydrogenase